MKRREFIQYLSNMLAGATSASLASCSTMRAGYLLSGSDIGVTETLNNIDCINQTIDSDVLFDVPSQRLVERGFNKTLCRDSIKSLLLLGTFGDLSKNKQAYPKMQQRMEHSAELFDKSVLGMATLLESLNRNERRQIKKLIKDDPNYIKSFQLAFNKVSENACVKQNRVDHFHSIYNKACLGLSRRNNNTVIDEWVEIADRAARRNGISSSLRRKLAKEWDEELVQSIYELKSNSSKDTNINQDTSNVKNKNKTKKMGTKKRVIRAGGRLLGLGLGTGVLGFAMTSGGNFSGAFIVTLGATLLLAGLIVLIIAGNLPEQKEVQKEIDKKQKKYIDRLQKATMWVKERESTSEKTQEELVKEASEIFNVQYDDIIKFLQP